MGVPMAAPDSRWRCSGCCTCLPAHVHPCWAVLPQEVPEPLPSPLPPPRNQQPMTANSSHPPALGKLAHSHLLRAAVLFLAGSVASVLLVGPVLHNLGPPLFNAGLVGGMPRATWESLPPRRVLIVQFVSSTRLKEFLHYWPGTEQNFVSTISNASFLLTYPHTDAEQLAAVPGDANWTLVHVVAHEHAFCKGPLHVYRTPAGSEVFTQAIITHLPRYYLDARRPPMISCNGKHAASLSYALYSGAIWTYHLIHLPILSKYDIYHKLDSDISFLKRMPFDIGEEMERRGCSFAHTAKIACAGCEAESVTALKAFAKKTGVQPASLKKSWCSGNNKHKSTSFHFYGNFQAWSTKIVRSKDVLDLSVFLYEDWERGYFLHRWGDQAPFALFACMALEIDDFQHSPHVCDFTSLRNDVFKHGLKISG